MRIIDLSSVLCSSALHIAARHDPVAAKLGGPGHVVDPGSRIGIGAGGVVDAKRRLARRWLKVDLAHRDANRWVAGRRDMHLAAAANGAGGYLQFGRCSYVGHRPSPAMGFVDRSEEHTSELQSLMRISYAVFCLKKK